MSAFPQQQQISLLDFVHERDVLAQLPAHLGQQRLVLREELHRRHASLKELGDKHPGSGERQRRRGGGGVRGTERSRWGGSGGRRKGSLLDSLIVDPLLIAAADAM